MSNNRNLSHLSLECILPYMDVNKRIQLSERSPTYRRLDNRVPLTIEILSTSPMGFQINSTRYSLETVQVHDNGIGGPVIDEVYNLRENMLKASLYFPDNLQQHKLYEEHLLLDLEPFEIRKCRLELSYTYNIGLMVVENGSENVRERITYNRTLGEAMFYFSKKFFVHPNLKIKYLHAHSLEILNSLQPSIAQPVRLVEFKDWTDHPVIQNAEKIILSKGGPWELAIKSNKRIHFNLETSEVRSLVMKCLIGECRIGSHFSAEVKNSTKVFKYITSIWFLGAEQKKTTIPESRSCVTYFHTRDGLEYHFYIEKVPKIPFGFTTNLNIKVTSNGYATLL